MCKSRILQGLIFLILILIFLSTSIKVKAADNKDVIMHDTYNEKKIYLLMDKVYPFIDLNSFIDKVDFLYDQGISFICSVMPVYENQDLDAMKRFCDVLRYAQSKGGKIILHSSVLYGANIQGSIVKEKMALAQQIYVKYSVYPLALDIPDSFLYKEDYKDLIESSNTVFIEKDDELGALDLKKYSIANFNRVIYKINFKDGYSNEVLPFSNIALSFSSDLDLDSFKTSVNHLINKKIFFNDVDYLSTLMKLGGMELSSNPSDILLDNKSVDRKYTAPKAQTKAKNKNQIIDISGAYSKITRITIVVCVFFVIIVLIGFKIDRKKFFR